MHRSLEIAIDELGYLEKQNKNDLDSKNANAGYGNFTKYARDLDAVGFYQADKQGLNWCDMFVDWCNVQAYGVETALQMTGQDRGGYGAGCTESINYFKRAGQFYKNDPQPGDQIFFGSEGSSYHTGIVLKVENGMVYTIEGNTSGDAGVVSNGGGVFQKAYPLNDSCIAGYGRPNWSIAKETPSGTKGVYEYIPIKNDPVDESEWMYHDDDVNFGREYRLGIGPAGTDGIEIGAEGPIPIHINFNIDKTDLTTQNTGKVSVWNLSDAHLSLLNEKDCCVYLKAGYGSRMSLIFAGSISSIKTSRDGADRETAIEIIDNLVEIRDTFVSLSYNGTVSWETIFNDVADQMGVTISFAYNVEFVDVFNGFSFVGKGKDVLTKGCACCGLAWSIQNGVIQIKKPNDVMKKEVYVLSEKTGLIGTPIRITTASASSSSSSSSSGSATTTTNQGGWEVDYFLNGAINIDDYVYLDCSLVRCFLRVASLNISGDNVSGDWICHATLLEMKDDESEITSDAQGSSAAASGGTGSGQPQRAKVESLGNSGISESERVLKTIRQDDSSFASKTDGRTPTDRRKVSGVSTGGTTVNADGFSHRSGKF